MSLLGLFQRKKAPEKYTFSDSDRQNSAEIRKLEAENRMTEMRLQHEIRKNELQLRKLELEDQVSEFFGDETDGEAEESSDPLLAMILPLLTGAGLGNKTTPQEQSSTQAPAPLHVSDEQIEAFIKEADKRTIKAARILNDEQLKEIIKQKAPVLIDDDSLNRAVAMIRNA